MNSKNRVFVRCDVCTKTKCRKRGTFPYYLTPGCVVRETDVETYTGIQGKRGGTMAIKVYTAQEMREMKYEYRITTAAADYGFLTLEKAKDFKRHHRLDEPIFRREVGEWEKLKE